MVPMTSYYFRVFLVDKKIAALVVVVTCIVFSVRVLSE